MRCVWEMPEKKADGRGKHPNSQRNLTLGNRWGPGQSGNPGGKPKGKITETLKALLTEADAETIAATLVAFAKKGSVPHLQLLLERLEGKVPTPVEQSGPAGGPIEHRYEEIAGQLSEGQLDNVIRGAFKRAAK